MEGCGYCGHIDESRSRFDEFPLHLGIAVCAFDVDDSAFRQLPYYPRELVGYYRAHRRQTRDAWRTDVIDPGIGLPENARPLPKKKYVLSKVEAYKRWVELVCGEQTGLIDVASKALGKRKTMPALGVALAALAAAGLGVCADLKDDESVEAQAVAMCQSWKLAALEIPGMDQQGPARITVILNALQELDTQAGQRLAVLDGDDGNWRAVLYSYHHEAEFSTLCEQLSIKRLPRDQWQ